MIVRDIAPMYRCSTHNPRQGQNSRILSHLNLIIGSTADPTQPHNNNNNLVNKVIKLTTIVADKA